jgi:hypothetical protein
LFTISLLWLNLNLNPETCTGVDIEYTLLDTITRERKERLKQQSLMVKRQAEAAMKVHCCLVSGVWCLLSGVCYPVSLICCPLSVTCAYHLIFADGQTTSGGGDEGP